jgi:hypothetical protein
MKGNGQRDRDSAWSKYRQFDEVDEAMADPRAENLPARRSQVDADRLLQLLDELEREAE